MMNYTLGTKVLLNTTCVTPCILCPAGDLDGLLNLAIGSLCKDDGDGNKDGKKATGLD